MNTSNRLKLIRKKLDLTQESLAISIGLNRDNITNLESGKVKFSRLHALALEYVHGVNKDWILNGNEPIFINEQKTEFDRNSTTIHLDPVIRILNEALEETDVEINENQREYFLKIIREDLEKSDLEIKEEIKKYIRVVKL